MRYKNFMPRTKEEFEKEEFGPDKLPAKDKLFNKRSTKEYEEIIEKEKVEKILGIEETKKISKPLVSKLRKYKSKSQERKRKKKSKKCRSPEKKKDRKNSVNITLLKSDEDLRRN